MCINEEIMVTIPLKELGRYKRQILQLRDLLQQAKELETRLTPGNVSHRGFLSHFLTCGVSEAKKMYDELQKLYKDNIINNF